MILFFHCHFLMSRYMNTPFLTVYYMIYNWSSQKHHLFFLASLTFTSRVEEHEEWHLLYVYISLFSLTAYPGWTPPFQYIHQIHHIRMPSHAWISQIVPISVKNNTNAHEENKKILMTCINIVYHKNNHKACLPHNQC